MYVPEVFRLDDRAALLAHIAAYPFATVITGDGGDLTVSHLPLLIDAAGKVLRGLTIFHGPHGYVSPSVYVDHPSVPTWNYAVVHARGRARIVDEDRLRAILDDTTTHFDKTGWRLPSDEQFVRSKLGAIAGFEVEIQQLEGKWKLSQNRSVTEQARVVAWLENGDDQSRALAALMRDRL
jgi:transcriptional regulator